MKSKKLTFHVIMAFVISIFIIAIPACNTDARIASQNISKAAEQFEITRRIIFYNGITNDYILVIEGRCDIHDLNKQLEVTCKYNNNAYKKHFLGLSDNVTYFAEQLETANVSKYHYRVIFKPQSIIPSVDLEGNL